MLAEHNISLWQDEQFAFVGALLKNNLAESLLFSGSLDAGRAYFMRQIAKNLICQKSAAIACGSCQQCSLFLANNHPDVLFLGDDLGLEMIKIDQIRYMVNFLTKTPAIASCKIAVLFNAAKLNIASANALLKTLEEPLGTTKILLGANTKKQLLPTIVSRCREILVPVAKNQAKWLKLATNNEKADVFLALAANLPLLARKYASDESYQALLATLFAWPVAPLDFWLDNLTGLVVVDILNLMQVLLHDALAYLSGASNLTCSGFKDTWLDQVNAIKDLNRVYLALSYCNKIKAMLSEQVSLNNMSIIQQLFIIWSGVWFEE